MELLLLVRDVGGQGRDVPVDVRVALLTAEGTQVRPLLIPEQAALIEPDPAKARALARQYTRFLLGLPNYVNNLRWLGFGDEDFTDGGSDRLVGAVIAWGDVDAIRARVREHLDAGADHVLVQPLTPDQGLGLDQLRTLAPALVPTPR